MMDLSIILPSKPKIITENSVRGIYEIDGLYPGYGQTLGNSLRRVILSSMVGTTLTSLKIEGVDHEFSTIKGVKEDVIQIILNLKKVLFKLAGDERQTVSLKIKGSRQVKANDIEVGGQVEILNPELSIATLTDKNSALNIEMVVEKGIGYVPKESLRQDNQIIGKIVLDAVFTPVRRVSYEVENMRVGDRTDFNRLRLSIETNGVVSPREVLEKSIEIMINQLKAIIGFREVESANLVSTTTSDSVSEVESDAVLEEGSDWLKTRVENLNLSPRVQKALAGAGIRTVGGLHRKRLSDLREIGGLGDKGIEEIAQLLQNHNLILRD